jgi:predicted dehydrogenase
MRVGVIGLGSIGSRHKRNLLELGHEVLSYDPKDGDTEEKLHKIHTLADAIVIASPTPTHGDHIVSAFDLNRKHIFVEKPLADTLDVEAEWVAMVGYNLRFHSCVIKAKEWIDSNFLGELQWANFVCAQHNTKYKDHVILNWSHEIDLALELLGSGTGVVSCTGTDRIADLTLAYKDPAWATIHLDYVTQPEIRQSIIVGEDAIIIMDLLNRQAWLRSSKGTIIDHHEGDDTWDSNYLDEMETFIARVEGKETIGCTGAEGLEVLKVCLEAKRLSQSR